jgi:hypothetical protein
MRWCVYDFIYKHGPVTATECWRDLSPNSATGVIAARVTELAQMGVLDEVGTKLDDKTGHRCVLWDVNENLPKKLKRSIPKRLEWKALNNFMVQIDVPYYYRKQIEDWLRDAK